MDFLEERIKVSLGVKDKERFRGKDKERLRVDD